METKIKVGLADDHPIFRRGLYQIIGLEENLELIWEAENGAIVLEKIRSDPPDVVILDIDMPVLDGIKTAALVRQEFSNIRIIFLTMHKDTQIFASMKNFGVKGYVLKDCAMQEIVTCINRVFSGQTYLTPELSEFILTADEPPPKPDDPLYIVTNLTGSEKRILALVAASKTSREIADELFLSQRTVENHRFNICKKLNLQGNHALLKFAIRYKNDIENLINE
jgi:DNA-binding NarL/FixJ family response regulator